MSDKATEILFASWAAPLLQLINYPSCESMGAKWNWMKAEPRCRASYVNMELIQLCPVIERSCNDRINPLFAVQYPRTMKATPGARRNLLNARLRSSNLLIPPSIIRHYAHDLRGRRLDGGRWQRTRSCSAGFTLSFAFHNVLRKRAGNLIHRMNGGGRPRKWPSQVIGCTASQNPHEK